MTARGALCVLAKLPRAGFVKTRLAKVVGTEAAVVLARAFLADTLAGLACAPGELVLALDQPPPAAFDFTGPIWLQGEGDLGERLERVLRRALEHHPWAVAFGTDSPGLPRRLPERACELLAAQEEAVVGPCQDGGFYLLGVRHLAKGTLRHVRWSTQHACADTELALRRAGSTPRRIEPWFDVDEAEDLEQLRRLLAEGTLVAPATAAVLGLA